MPKTAQANILIVDNGRENLVAVGNLLQDPGRHIVKARSGNAALALTFDHEFALVVLDVSLPDSNGLATAELLRDNQQSRDIPILFITAEGQEQPGEFKGCETGPVDYLVKPIDTKTLQSKLNIFLELFWHRQSLKRTTETLEQTISELEQANRKILEHENGIREEERLKVLLQMTGATAHEINQPLMTLLGHIESLKINKDKSDKVDQRIDTIREAGQKISEIVKKMQTRHSVQAKLCLDKKPSTDCSRTLNILSVEPSAEDFQRLATMLGRHSELRLSRASGIRSALDHLATEPVDVILAEHQLQDGNAFDFLKTIAGQGLTLPVVVVTGKGDELLAAEVIQAGACDYISKKWLSETCLLRSIHHVFEKHRLQKEKEALIKKMAEMSTRDELTGLYNRRYLREALEREMARAKRYGNELALCMIDLDHFKDINDTFGHPAGDSALAHIGEILNRSIRQSDLACRYGGDEFAIILPNATVEEASKVCERIRKLVARYQFPHESRTFRLTTSIGVAAFDPSCHRSAVDLLSSADQALYGSKKEGRNGVTWGRFLPRRELPLFSRGNGPWHPAGIASYCQNMVEAG